MNCGVRKLAHKELALAALEARNATERAQLRHAPREAAAERPALAWATPEDVIHLRLDN